MRSFPRSTTVNSMTEEAIGKRYRRQDEIGTPFCITYDFDSEDGQLRNRTFP